MSGNLSSADFFAEFSTDSLLVMALDMENVDNRLADYGEVVYTGVGKVNAALVLTRALALRQQDGHLPARVINLGSAGAHQRSTGSVVACTRFIQRDMDVTPLGVPLGQTPFEPDSDWLDCPLPSDWQQLGLIEATCYTGDQFVTEPHHHFEFDVVDMEGYALAKVCRLFGVPLISLKYITDGADGQAASDWPQALRQATDQLWHTLHSWQQTRVG